MENITDCYFTEYVDSRLDGILDELRKTNEIYRKNESENRKLVEQISQLSLSKDDKSILEQYFKTEFEMGAILQPAIYAQGFSDGIRLLIKLKLL
jgi:hypothetical protein